MKITQKRKVNRYINFFRNSFGFRVPYQVLIDGTFCLAALEGQVRVLEQLPKYFQCELKLLTTQCVILEMEKLGPVVHGALKICKHFAVHKCGHEKNPIAASKCLESMIMHDERSNPDRYILATQDPILREVARRVPGTPILYLHYRSPTLEKPSDCSITSAKSLQASVQQLDGAMQRLQQLKQIELGPQPIDVPRKRKRVKGPNPLSCKKKKRTTSSAPAKNSPNAVNLVPVKKKRRRVKIAKHIRQELSLQQKNGASQG